MSEHPAIYKITDKNVDAYEAYRDKLPCFAKFCAVTPLCFSERQATKRAKYLRYTVKFRDLCAEAFLIMHFIDMLPKVESDLEVSIKEMDKMPIDELFEESIYYFEGDLHDNSKALWTPYFMLIKVIEKDPNFVDDYGENPYYYLGKIYSEIFGENNFAIEFFSKSIDLMPNSSVSYEERGFCLLRNNDLENALDDFKATEAIDGGSYYSLKGLIKEIENRKKGFKGDPEYDNLFS